jgi:hypothetical protein
VLDDTLSEANERFAIRFPNLVNIGSETHLNHGQADITILDDESAGFSFDSITTTEGSANHAVRLLVRLTRPQAAQVSVDYATAIAGLAAPGADFIPASGTVVFAPGETLKTTGDIIVVGDTTAEFDETFAVNLTSPSSGTVILDSQASVTIDNDDGPVFVLR